MKQVLILALIVGLAQPLRAQRDGFAVMQTGNQAVSGQKDFTAAVVFVAPAVFPSSPLTLAQGDARYISSDDPDITLQNGITKPAAHFVMDNFSSFCVTVLTVYVTNNITSGGGGVTNREVNPTIIVTDLAGGTQEVKAVALGPGTGSNDLKLAETAIQATTTNGAASGSCTNCALTVVNGIVTVEASKAEPPSSGGSGLINVYSNGVLQVSGVSNVNFVSGSGTSISVTNDGNSNAVVTVTATGGGGLGNALVATNTGTAGQVLVNASGTPTNYWATLQIPVLVTNFAIAAAQSTVSITIPQTGRAVQFTYNDRSDSVLSNTPYVWMIFSGNSNAAYNAETVYGRANAAGAFTLGNLVKSNALTQVPDFITPAGAYGSAQGTIIDYTNTTAGKSYFGSGFSRTNAASAGSILWEIAGDCTNFAAVTTLTFGHSDGSNFTTNSTFNVCILP